ncbi:signal peptidase I [Patescibacteria group bacterium]
MRKFFLFVWETFKIVIFALAIVIPVRYYLIQPFFVNGASMEPNFQDGEYLIVDEISYQFLEPKRGEVIVFKYPINPSQYFIKRIIGLPNETIEIKDGKIVIYNDEFSDGQIIDESLYGPFKMTNHGTSKFILKDDEYFVLGDNRGASSDSRQWGSLLKKYIVGRVWIRAWPIDSVKVFEY